MSNYWGIHCVTCNSRAPVTRMNHGEEEMRALAAKAPALAIAGEALIRSGLHIVVPHTYVDGGPLILDDTGDLPWFVKHASHDVRAISEYGEIDGMCARFYSCACGSNKACAREREHADACGPARKP